MSSYLGLVLVLLATVWSVQGEKVKSRVRRDGHNMETVEIETSQGRFKGYIDYSDEGTRIQTFLSIPYAKKPVRFTAPERPDYHLGVFDATKHRTRCPHRPIPGDPTMDGVEVSEDCLNLDIYMPDGRDTSMGQTYPVMLYVHGGGYYGGSGTLYNYRQMAARGVIVITINYRLDIFGFLSTQDDAISGNFALMDLEMALDWLWMNSYYIGADTSKITGFGSSAGAAMLSIARMSPKFAGKFNSIILQSGSALAQWAVYQDMSEPYKPQRLAGELGDQVGCEVQWQGPYPPRYDTYSLRNCLMNVDMYTLMNASIFMQENTFYDYFGGMIWVPVVDNYFGANFLPDYPKNLIRNVANLWRIPTIYGYSAQDGSWLIQDRSIQGMSMDVFMSYLEFSTKLFFPDENPSEIMYRVKEAYIPAYREYTPEELLYIMVEILTDLTMVVPMVQEARMYEAAFNGMGESYMYVFNHKPSWQSTYPWWFGTSHTAEKGFVLGLPNGVEGFSYPSVTSEDRTVAKNVVEMWTNFAKYWNPTLSPVNGVTWPTFIKYNNIGNPEEQVLYIQEKLEVEAFMRSDKIKAWIDHPEERTSSTATVTQSLTFLLALVGVARLLTFRP